MKIFQSGEDYLERILILRKKLPNVRLTDIANDMNYSKASVSVALKKLKSNNLIEINTEGFITLTSEGEKLALDIYEKHNWIFSLLTHIGVNEKTALEDACKIEHSLSEETFEKLKSFLNNTIK